MKNFIKYLGITFAIIATDQVIKLWMHFDVLPNRGGELPIVGQLFKLHYVLNPGMAFGMEFDYQYGKLFLSLFRLIAMILIGRYLYNMCQKNAHTGLLWCLALIWGGAVGNLVDSIFYGVWLHNSPEGVASPWFHGQVIDMFFFDPWQGFIPEWFPLWGGSYYSTPIFNFADASIFVGVVAMLMFQDTFFGTSQPATQASNQVAEGIEEMQERLQGHMGEEKIPSNTVAEISQYPIKPEMPNG